MAQVLEATALRSLADVIAAGPAEHGLTTGFAAQLTAPLVGGDVAAHAVVTGTIGERTVVVKLEDGERRLARIPDVLVVDPASLGWVRVGSPRRQPWFAKP